jgi:hypothetical protein
VSAEFFFQGREKFLIAGGGAKTYSYCLQKTLKKILFFSKKSKNTILLGKGGEGVLSYPPQRID